MLVQPCRCFIHNGFRRILNATDGLLHGGPENSIGCLGDFRFSIFDPVGLDLLSVKAEQPSLRSFTKSSTPISERCYDGQRFYRQGIIPRQAVDTMGAGDSLIAGFLHGYLEGLDLPACMTAGAQCSAVTLSYEGAW